MSMYVPYTHTHVPIYIHTYAHTHIHTYLIWGRDSQESMHAMHGSYHHWFNSLVQSIPEYPLPLVISHVLQRLS